MKPLIGITVDCEFDPEDARTRGKLTLNWNYAQAVADAGGIPILIPPMADVAVISKLIHGWLIPGGNDIDAKEWGEENHPTVTPIERERFEGEKRLYAAIPGDLPVFGICYGCQFINVMQGGSLIQDIPSAGDDYATHTGGPMQTYQIDEGSKIAALAGSTTIEGKSYHHQAVGKVGTGLQVVGRGEDGIVEAIEATDRPWLIGLQWHPERTLEDSATRNLFMNFIRASMEYAERP